LRKVLAVLERLVFAGLLAGPPAEAAARVTLTPLLPSPQPVGSTVMFVATGVGGAPLIYQFRVGPPEGPMRVVRDFSPSGLLDWTSIEEGVHVIAVTARDPESGETAEASLPYFLASRSSPWGPVVSPTPHPLVALYSAPPCEAGTMRVSYTRVGAAYAQYTPAKPCDPRRGMNFYVAGLRGNSTYVLRHEILSGRRAQLGPTLEFTSGTPNPEVQRAAVFDPPDAQTSLAEPVLLFTSLPMAIDLGGRMVWYYDKVMLEHQVDSYMFRPTPDGTFLLTMNDDLTWRVLREVDVAGNTVRETNARAVAEQLVARGQDPVTAFHHDALRLANGHTLVFGSAERIVVDQQGPGPVDVLGDLLIDLDENLQVAWVWNSFEHLDITRKASMGEVCSGPRTGCPHVGLAPLANDWTHSNSISRTDDGDLVISMRNQDWVLKIDYDDGMGTGAVLWKLGMDGDFALASGEESDWFSHQHDAQVLDGSSILLFDNSDLRCHPLPRDACSSRGQLWTLDEQAMTATPTVNIEVGTYSPAVGSAQRLANGNFSFFSGMAVRPIVHGEVIEFTPEGTPVFGATTRWQYRTYRMRSIYGL
jgi:hypothetical protein